MVLSMDRWLGKVAIVTGASAGIGAAIVDALIDHGLIVVGLARRVELIEEKAKKLAGKKGKLYAVKTDLTQEKDILAAFKWIKENLGPVHILINNAGYLKEDLLIEGKTEDWKRIFDVNVFALSIATREAVQVMKQNGVAGHIVHINSIAGHQVTPYEKMNVYSASKFAVTALTETLRRELVTLGSKIRVTSVSPGFVESEMTVYNKNNSPERQEVFESQPSLKGEDIADGVVYALSTPEHVQVHEVTIKPVGETI